MADKAHRKTNKQLARMERRLKRIYAEAQSEIEAKATEYFEQFKKLDAAKLKQVQDGILSQEDYKRWRKNKFLYSERWSKERERIVSQYANVRSTALAYINGQLPEVYCDNYNFIQGDIGSRVQGYSFELVNPDTVRELAREDATFLPYKEVNLRKYQRWCAPKINSEILKGVLMGDSIPDLAKRLRIVSQMDCNAAIRNARTMVTSAENKARQDGFERATGNGIILKREWIAARDTRTRDAHVHLNGQLADTDQPFHSDLGDIMYPGDPSAHPANVYNCRCTLGSKILGFKKQNGIGEVLISEKESGIIGLQFFAEKDIKRQDSSSLIRAMRKYKKRIEEHKDKISQPHKYIKNWDALDQRKKDGMIRHWQKEMDNFQESIENRIHELKERGEYNE